jgi:hypothetical protein
MRRAIIATTLVVLLFGSGAPALVNAETTTTSEAPVVTTSSTSSTSTTSTTTTTTTTVPTAVTTVPEGCPLAPVAQAVFVGIITALDPVAAVFTVTQVRAGTLDGYINANSVEVRYGRDVKYLEKNQTYIVGVALDSVTQNCPQQFEIQTNSLVVPRLWVQMCGVRNSKQQLEHCTTMAPVSTPGCSLPSLINQSGCSLHWCCQRFLFFWRY